MREKSEDIRNATLFLFGAFISSLGNGIQILCSAYLVLKITGSIVSVGVLFVLITIPEAVITIIFGEITDRLNKKNISICADLLRGIVALVIPLMVLLDVHSATVVYAVSIVIAIGDAIFVPASNGLIQSAVSGEIYQKFSAWYEISIQSGVLISVAAGGFLVDWFGVVPVLCFNGISYFISAICISFMIYKRQYEGINSGSTKSKVISFYLLKSMLLDFMKIKYLLACGISFGLIRIIVTVSNTLLVPLVLKQESGGMGTLGIADASAGVGMALAGIISLRIFRQFGEEKMLLAGYLGCGLFLGLLPNFGRTGIIIFTLLNAVFFGWGRIATRSALLRTVPKENSGRHFGLYNGIGLLFAAVISLVLSKVSEVAGFSAAYGAFAVIIIAVALLAGLLFTWGRQAEAKNSAL